LLDSLYGFDLETRALDQLVLVETGKPQNHINDGRCDRRGRFWVGSMNAPPKNPEGACYRIDADLSAHMMFDEVINTNSIAFSPDDRTFYFSDNRRFVIYAFDLDVETGTLANRRVFVDSSKHPGRPDGSTVDAEGCLWNAEFRGRRVVRYMPDGRIDRIIELPVSQPTSCAFGGANLDVLFVTTGTLNMPPRERAAEPLAGSLFAIDVGVQGVPEPYFAG
jgi:L-arabinonolactonase